MPMTHDSFVLSMLLHLLTSRPSQLSFPAGRDSMSLSVVNNADSSGHQFCMILPYFDRVSKSTHPRNPECLRSWSTAIQHLSGSTK